MRQDRTFRLAASTVPRTQTIANFIEKASRLYEQKRRAVIAATALETWGRQRLRWAMSGAKCPHPNPSFNEQHVCWRSETDKALKIGGAC